MVNFSISREWIETALSRPPVKHGLRAFGQVSLFSIWTLLFRLLAMTLVTSMLISPETRFSQVTDAFESIEIIISGLGVATLILISRALSPLAHPRNDDLISSWKLEKRFLPGLAIGLTLGALFTSALILGGTAQWMGSTFTYEDAALTLTNTLIRSMALFLLVWGDEFFFRSSVQSHFQKFMRVDLAILITAFCFASTKLLQFDLGRAQWLTLFLVSLNLGFRTWSDGDFARAAGVWVGFLLLLHPVLSLPVLGNDIQGLLSVKTFAPPSNPAIGVPTLFDPSFMGRWISGGLGGPLSSLALQVLIFADTFIRWRKHFRVAPEHG
jgi:hypothetical protein